MRLWTAQETGFYDDLITNGIAYCTKVCEIAIDNGYAYEWMAEQMKKRIGLPPLLDIKLPVWAWYQYSSKKKRKPLKSKFENLHDTPCVLMELEVPDNQVLLSDFSLWHIPLNAGHIIKDKKLSRKIDAYYPCEFSDFPANLQKVIKDSWEVIFDLRNRDRDLNPKAMSNKSIQATLWCVRKEWLVSVVDY